MVALRTLLPLLPAALIGSAYAWALWRRRGKRPAPPAPWRRVAFFAGVLALGAAVSAFAEDWSSRRFSAHMIQHLVLLQVAPPLLLLGRADRLLLQTAPRIGAALLRPLQWRWAQVAAVILSSPLLVFLAYNAGLAGWHWPQAYEAALARPALHALEHAVFFGGAMAFWWLVLEPLPAGLRASPHALIGLAIGTCMIGNVIAAALTVSSRVLYPTYAITAAAEGIDALADQHLGGAVMWVSGAIYFAVALVVLWRTTASSVNELAESAARPQ
jgi:cytochrome c oxidase assembly factor CtaG